MIDTNSADEIAGRVTASKGLVINILGFLLKSKSSSCLMS